MKPPKLQHGDRVRHENAGVGRVTASTRGGAWVRFTGDTRSVWLPRAELRKVEGS